MSDELSVVYNNNLRHEGRTLWANVLAIPYCSVQRNKYKPVSPEELKRILELGHAFIELTIQDLYEKQRAMLEPSSYIAECPSISIMQLGSASQTDGKNSEVYSAEGSMNGKIHRQVCEQQPAFTAYWNVVEEAGFFPHVMSRLCTTKLASDDGAYLMLQAETKA